MKYLKDNLISILTLIGLTAISLYYYPTLPGAIPTKFDFTGKPTQYSSREFVALFVPCIYLSMILLINLLVRISPSNFSMPNSKKAISQILSSCGALFLGMHLGLVVDPSGTNTFARFFSFGVALFLIFLGNILGKTERNFFMGVRVPWTLNSEANWRATHRFTGKIMVLFGMALLVISFFYSHLIFSISAILIPTLTPVLYSYMYYRKNEMKTWTES